VTESALTLSLSKGERSHFDKLNVSAKNRREEWLAMP
jgi:hypothetical protein